MPMPRTPIRFARLVVFLAVAMAPSFAPAQRQPASIERRSIWDSPAIRNRLYNRAIDRYMQDLTQAFDLTDEQRRQVGERLEALKQDQLSYAESGREEMNRLRDQLGELGRQRRAGKPVDEREMEEAGRRVRELWQGSPLLNPDKIAGEVEKLLPGEQARKGRPKWEAVRRERVRQLAERFPRLRELGAAVGESADRIDTWQRFVELFCRKFDLDDAQHASAQSVLRDVQERRDSYLTSHAADLEAARQIEDAGLRRERIDQLMEPIDKLYAELRGRLDKIPTSSQLEAVRVRAATQPAQSAPAKDEGSDKAGT